MKEDKLDWFAAVTLNPDKDYAHFSIAGYDDRNTIMKSPEEYKKNKRLSFWLLRNESQFNEPKFYDGFLANFTEYGYTADSSGVYEPLLDEEGKPKINPNSGRLLPDKTKVIIYFVGVSTMASKLKSIDTKNIKWIIVDEVIPNLKVPGQRYLKGEAEGLMSVYNSLARNNDYETKIILIGNLLCE